MTKEECIEILDKFAHHSHSEVIEYPRKVAIEAFEMAIEALKAEPCEDAVSRQAVLDAITANCIWENEYNLTSSRIKNAVEKLSPVIPKQRLCKDCKFFEYDHIENVDGIPLIVAHEICNRWGDGCRTSEDGYCFLFEPKKEGENK